MEATKELVKLSLGVCILAPWIAKKEIEEGSLVALPLGRKKLTTPLGHFAMARQTAEPGGGNLHRPVRIRLHKAPHAIKRVRRQHACMTKKIKAIRETSLQPRLRISSGGDIALGPGKVELLVLVKETGSISEAAKRMEMSYMRAWSLIQTMNACFKEPVVEAARGGHKRGGAELTETGHRALELYQRMEETSLKAAQSDWQTLRKLLRD